LLKIIKELSRLVLLLAFIMLVGLNFTACDNGELGDASPDTYTIEVIIEGVANEDHAGLFSVLKDGDLGIDHFSYENNTLTGDITGLTGTTELTLVIDDNLEEGEYKTENEIIDVDSDDNEAKFEVDFIGGTEPVNPGEMVLVEEGSKGGITISNDFYIGKFHVTQAEFKDVMGFNPSYFNDDDHSNLVGNSDNRPVERVTWYDAVKYANELSKIEELDKYYNISDIRYDGDNIISATVTRNMEANGYRLPTRKEHEYAARGGSNGNRTTYSGSNNLDEVGWYRDDSDTANSDRDDNKGTMPVGEKKSNELGIYDMSGNVWDWTSTELRNRKIKRGDSWIFGKHLSEVHYIYVSEESKKFLNLGFRLARSTE